MWKFLQSSFGPSIENLLLAIELGQEDKSMRFLKRNPSLINQKNEFGMSPLMYAVLRGKATIVSMLLNMDADPNLLHENESTPLMVAVLEGEEDLLGALLAEEKLKINLQDRFGGSALMYAARMKKVETVKALLAKGANPNLRDVDGETTLMYALIGGEKEIVASLLEAGADKDATNFDGLTAYDKAINKEIQALLK
ncbi:MAG: ankyrin repeat domain-containing protein [Bacteroidota bacterium]